MVIIMISIVVAVYNVEQYLEKCIESIVRQTYSDIEIILIDDGSTDGSADICDTWSDNDTRVVVCHQQNAGVSSARNKGISIASGEYMIFVDSDDWLEENFVEQLYEYHKKGELTLTGYYIDYEKKSKKFHRVKHYSEEEICYLAVDQIVSLFSCGLFSPIWNKLYDKEILLSHNIRFREDMDLGEDIVFNLEYIKLLTDKICVINFPLYHYMRRGEDSLDFSYHKNYISMQKIIYSEFFDYMSKISVDEQAKIQLMSLYFNALVTAVDNLYIHRKNIDHSFYLSGMKERIKEPEFHILLKNMKGRTKIIYSIRLFFIYHGFYVFDYYLRKLVKKLLRLE